MSEFEKATALREALESWDDHLRPLRGTRLVSVDVEQFREIVRLALAASAPSPAATGSGVASDEFVLRGPVYAVGGYVFDARREMVLHVHDHTLAGLLVDALNAYGRQAAPAVPDDAAVRRVLNACLSDYLAAGDAADFLYRQSESNAQRVEAGQRRGHCNQMIDRINDAMAALRDVGKSDGELPPPGPARAGDESEES